MKRFFAFASVVAIAFTLVMVTRAPAQSSRKKAAYEEKLWQFLQNNKYKNWAPVPGESDAAYEGAVSYTHLTLPTTPYV